MSQRGKGRFHREERKRTLTESSKSSQALASLSYKSKILSDSNIMTACLCEKENNPTLNPYSL
jgi:hypothetical protein